MCLAETPGPGSNSGVGVKMLGSLQDLPLVIPRQLRHAEAWNSHFVIKARPGGGSDKVQGSQLCEPFKGRALVGA